MRILIAVALLASAAGRAQTPVYLLNDLDSAAKRDVPYLAVEARLRIAELTRLSNAGVSRRFAVAAAMTGAQPCGMACYYAMRTLASIDMQAAMALADLNEWEPAYRALTEQAVYNRDPETFLRILDQGQRHGHFVMPATRQVLEQWGGGDQRFVKDLTLALINAFPAEPDPDEATFLFETFLAADPTAINPDLIRKAVERVVNAVTKPAFNGTDPFPFETTFSVRGKTIRTYSRAEAAYLRALAFGAAIDEKVYIDGAAKLTRWSALLRGLTIDTIGSEFKTIGVREIRPPRRPQVPDTIIIKSARRGPFDEEMLALEKTSEPITRYLRLMGLASNGDLNEVQFAKLFQVYKSLLSSFDGDGYWRLKSAADLFQLSRGWPAVQERDSVIALYANEIERIAAAGSVSATGLRDSGDLLTRLDTILEVIGRVPAKWPECVRDNPSLLLRHLVHEIEQATLYSTIDETFHIVGGSDLTLRSLRGRVVVIAFWRSDCERCQMLRLAINQLNNPVGRNGIWVIAVSDQEEAAVTDTLEQNPFWASIAFDPTSRVQRSLGIRNLPSAVVIDREGRVVSRIQPVEVRDGREFPLEDLYNAIENAGAPVPDKLRIR